jgi:hypothetical protein
MTATIGTTKDVLAISAFGFEIRLWQESTEVEWSATIEDGKRCGLPYFRKAIRCRQLSSTERWRLNSCD